MKPFGIVVEANDVTGFASKEFTLFVSDILKYVSKDSTNFANSSTITRVTHVAELKVKRLLKDPQFKAAGQRLLVGMIQDAIAEGVSQVVFEKTGSNFWRGASWFFTKEIFALSNEFLPSSNKKKLIPQKILSSKLRIARAQADVLIDVTQKLNFEINLLKQEWVDLIAQGTYKSLELIFEREFQEYLNLSLSQRDLIRNIKAKSGNLILPSEIFYRDNIYGNFDLRKNRQTTIDKGKIKRRIITTWIAELEDKISSKIYLQDYYIDQLLNAGKFFEFDEYVKKTKRPIAYNFFANKKKESPQYISDMRLVAALIRRNGGGVSAYSRMSGQERIAMQLIAIRHYGKHDPIRDASVRLVKDALDFYAIRKPQTVREKKRQNGRPENERRSRERVISHRNGASDLSDSLKAATAEKKNESPLSSVWFGFLTAVGLTRENDFESDNYGVFSGGAGTQNRSISNNNRVRVQNSNEALNTGEQPAFRSGEVSLARARYFEPNVFTNLNDSRHGTYSHTAWGKWNGSFEVRTEQNKPVTMEKGYWVIGNMTKPETIANRTGSATYSGNMIGDFVAKGTSEILRGVIFGDINLNMNFSNRTVTGQLDLDINKAGTRENWIRTSLRNGTINPNFLAKDFKIPLFFADTSNRGGGGVTGIYYGPNGEEVGGSFHVKRDKGDSLDGQTAGVYRAKEQ